MLVIVSSPEGMSDSCSGSDRKNHHDKIVNRPGFWCCDMVSRHMMSDDITMVNICKYTCVIMCSLLSKS